ncbi:MAG: S9 family peptidase [Melioribacteraceae bacterium]|nr:S9 family peptidase [Melioribacteraceae bacterium]
MTKNKIVFIIIILVSLTVSGCKENNMNSKNITAPMAKKIPTELVKHNHKRIDNYYWLNERENPEVIKYLEDENNYTKKILEDTEGLQDELYKEMVGRVKEEDESAPYFSNEYYYYNRYEKGQEYPLYCRKKEGFESDEIILLNVPEKAQAYSYYHVQNLSVSPNNIILAFGIDTLSRRRYTIKFKDLKTGKLLKDEIPNTTGSLIWANDNKTSFYTVKDKTLRSYKIFKHVLGSDVSDDVEVFHESDEAFSTYVYKTKSKEYIIIGSQSTLSAEFRFIKADEPSEKFKLITPREKNLEYHVDHRNDHFYIRTNLDAKNFRLMKTPINKTEKKYWTEVISHNKDVLLEDFEIFDDFLVLNERIKGLTNFRIINLQTNSEHYLDFGEETYSAYTSNNFEFNTDILRFSYSSLTTPSSTFDYNMNTKKKKLIKQQEVLGKFNKENYLSKRLFATAKDGTQIPISLVYKKDIKLNTTNPLLLYAYGSYGASMDPYFSFTRLSLLNRGFIFAIAHVRGGQELGRDWYENGKLLKKKNSFTDFIDCAEYLISEKYTEQNKLFGMGGSAGGLLIGAVSNMAPDLFNGLVAQVPFVDVITTMLDESIPLTTSEYDEWGNPNDKTYYDYMLSYSPYDQVEAKNYPSLLVTTGLHDSQVQYWEPAKWIAKLRDLKTDDNMLLLNTNMEAGHGGASGRFQAFKEISLEYAFLLNLLK